MKMLYGSHGRPLVRPCEKCEGKGSIPAPGTDASKGASVVCPLCRGTKVKSTILTK